MDLIELFGRGTEWTSQKIAGLAPERFGASTVCDEWDVRSLVNHLLAGQQLFVKGIRGEVVTAPPQGPPPDLMGDDPRAQYEEARSETLAAFREPGALERPLASAGGDPRPGAALVGIAFADQLVHGWDLAKATGQDATMPADLAAAAWQILDGRISDEARGPGRPFKAAVTVGADASAQDKLLAYCGRTP